MQQLTVCSSSNPTVAAAVAESPPQIAEQVQVELGERSYPIYIGKGLLDQGALLRQHVTGKNVLVVTNETVAPLYLDRYSVGTRPCLLSLVAKPQYAYPKDIHVCLSCKWLNLVQNTPC